jgi:hypothetical protein
MQQQWLFSSMLVTGTGGVRYTIHQVQNLEPVFSIPFTISVADERKNVELSLSSAAGPSFPTYGAMLAISGAGIGAPNLKAQLAYYHGYSRTGVELAKPKNSFIELGTTVNVFN